MSIPFARSTRSMNQDRYLPGLISLILISLTLILWMIWFFTGRLNLYASTMDFNIREDGMLLCVFPPATLPQIKPGQQAELILSGTDGQSSSSIPGEVMNVPDSEGGTVEVYLFTSEPPLNQTGGQLKVRLGQSSPASLIWRAIQK